MINNKFPSIDGHFWVQRNGKVIDPHFPTYNSRAFMRGVSNKKNYREAPKEVQEYFINLLKPFWEEQKKHGFYTMPGYCMFNACLEVEQKGGEIKFGSMGFGNGKNIFWEYGDPTWRTVDKFLKKLV